MPLVYHAGQLAVQEEARTRVVADKLAHWVGPVGEFAADADLFLLATRDGDGTLRFTTLAGRPPLVEVIGPARLRLMFPPGRSPAAAGPIACGGLAINLGRARRARVNGTLRPGGEACVLDATETFTLCRKYMAPSLALDERPHAGPLMRGPLAPDDPWLAGLLARAETSFLASAGPDGAPDVAHRGGPPGFITFDPSTRLLSWPEYLGDGVFKSAGNVRATNSMTLLVVDTESGDGVELIGRGDYTNERTDRQDRLDPLIRHRDPYPIQGVIRCEVERIDRVTGLMHPRRRIEKAEKVTSRSTVDEQAPR